ncbi:Uncharacterised protein [Micrococcus luteus]|nr:transposase [Micrococcus luteus]STY67584.1 Uncharacterised protein [Micrococcus luteus]
MAAPKKYPDELRERATRLAVEARQDRARRAGALQRIGEQLGINPETLRGWVKQAEIDAGQAPGVTTGRRSGSRRLRPRCGSCGERMRWRIQPVNATGAVR